MGKVLRFLMFLDDLAEVLVLHVLFTRKNWMKTVAALAIGAGLAWWAFGPGGPAVHARRGWEALVGGRTPEAVADLSRAVQGAPGSALDHQRLGVALLEQGSAASALTELETAYRLSPSRRTLFFIGCAYQGLKLHTAAGGVFQQVMSTSPGEAALPEPAAAFAPAALAKIGECFLKKGELERARTHLERTAALYPTYPHTYFYLGLVHWEAGNLDLGVEQFFKVIELYPAEPAAHYNIACYYALKGIPDLALVWLERSFEAGFTQFDHVDRDHDLDGIRSLPQFARLLARYRAGHES